MKESITKQRKWNLIAGGSDPANDVVSAELCQGIEDAMRHAYAKMKWLGRRKPGVRAHIIDPVMPPQPVSDTPRTDEISNASGNSWMNGNLCRQLERELNAANERIKLLEQALEAMSKVIGPPGKSTWVSDDELHRAWALYILAKDSQ